MDQDRPDAWRGVPPPGGAAPPPPPPQQPWEGPGVPPPPGSPPRPDRVVPLREMRPGEILDSAVNLYRRHWKVFMAIVAVLIVPFTLIRAIVGRAVTHPFISDGRVFISTDDASRLLIVSVVFAVASFLLVTPLLTAAMVRAVGDSYMGEKPDVARSYRTALPRLGPVLLVVFLSTLAVIGGFILLIVPGLVFYVRFLFAPQVVVLEESRGRAAMGRSWRLTRKRFLSTFGTVFLAGILAGVLTGILVLPASLAAQHFLGGWIANAVAGAIASVVTTPFITTVHVLLYFDLRIRKEGLDLAIMAQELSRAPGGP